jgi:NAD(P)H-nitrite reductase large subunit
MSTSLNIVIIGNGAAGISAAETARKQDPDCQVTIIAKEDYRTYYRPAISKHLHGKIDENNFYLKSEKWYAENKIRVLNGIEAEKIDLASQTVLIPGKEISWDRLILACGSNPFVPPIKNIDVEGVFTLRSYDDSLAIKEYVKSCKQGVVIGGGVLGLEAAWALKKTGIEMTVIEVAPRLLPVQLDQKGSDIFSDYVEKSGIKMICGEYGKEIGGENSVSSVLTSGGRELPADFAIISAGVRSETSLAQAAGLAVDKGIKVDRQMRTSQSNVFAAGDCAQLPKAVPLIWPVAKQMGQIAGANSLGQEKTFKIREYPIFFEGMGTTIFSVGDLGRDEKIDYEIWERAEKGNIFENAYFKDGKLCGGILVGESSLVKVIMPGLLQKMEKEEFLNKVEQI